MTTKQWYLKKRRIGGDASVGLGMVGQMQADIDPMEAVRRSFCEKLMEKPWVKVLESHGALTCSFDPDRPYRWLWEVKDLVGLKPYSNCSWSQWAGNFYHGGKPLKSAIRNYTGTPWTTPKKIKTDDFQEGREVNLPAILEELREYF